MNDRLNIKLPEFLEQAIEFLSSIPGDKYIVGGTVIKLVKHRANNTIPLFDQNSDLDFVIHTTDTKAIEALGFSAGRYNDLFTMKGKYRMDLFVISDKSFDIKKDAMRRDFRKCAVYYNCQTNRLEDPFDGKGIEDIEENRLVLINDFDTVFKSQPDRFLRAVKYIATGDTPEDLIENEQPIKLTDKIKNYQLIGELDIGHLYSVAKKHLEDLVEIKDGVTYLETYNEYVKLLNELGLLKKLLNIDYDHSNSIEFNAMVLQSAVTFKSKVETVNNEVVLTDHIKPRPKTVKKSIRETVSSEKNNKPLNPKAKAFKPNVLVQQPLEAQVTVPTTVEPQPLVSEQEVFPAALKEEQPEVRITPQKQKMPQSISHVEALFQAFTNNVTKETPAVVETITSEITPKESEEVGAQYKKKRLSASEKRKIKKVEKPKESTSEVKQIVSDKKESLNTLLEGLYISPQDEKDQATKKPTVVEVSASVENEKGEENNNNNTTASTYKKKKKKDKKAKPKPVKNKFLLFNPNEDMGREKPLIDSKPEPVTSIKPNILDIQACIAPLQGDYPYMIMLKSPYQLMNNQQIVQNNLTLLKAALGNFEGLQIKLNNLKPLMTLSETTTALYNELAYMLECLTKLQYNRNPDSWLRSDKELYLPILTKDLDFTLFALSKQVRLRDGFIFPLQATLKDQPYVSVCVNEFQAKGINILPTLLQNDEGLPKSASDKDLSVEAKLTFISLFIDHAFDNAHFKQYKAALAETIKDFREKEQNKQSINNNNVTPKPN